MPKGSSRRWLKEHFNDPYVKKAHHEGWRSRAVFKLEELDLRYHLFSSGMTVIDLGAAPGGWSEYLRKRLGKSGCIVAVDILPMPPIQGVTFIQGDFKDNNIGQKLDGVLAGKSADWLISDMAPNLSGVESIDQPRAIQLSGGARDAALQWVKPGGGLLVKAFQGEGFDDFLVSLRQYFTKICIRKPKASRGRSKEVYILARTRK